MKECIGRLRPFPACLGYFLFTRGAPGIRARITRIVRHEEADTFVRAKALRDMLTNECRLLVAVLPAVHRFFSRIHVYCPSPLASVLFEVLPKGSWLLATRLFNKQTDTKAATRTVSVGGVFIV